MARLRSSHSYDISRFTPTVVRLTSYRSESSPHVSCPSWVPAKHKKAPQRSVQIPVQPAGGSLLTLTLPLPPSINHQYASVQGRRLLSSAGRRFKHHVGQEVLCHFTKQRGRPSRVLALDGLALALDLRFYFVSALRRDIDGGLKITQDALCEALGINDNLIVEVLLRKEIDAASPRMELSLRIAQILT